MFLVRAPNKFTICDFSECQIALDRLVRSMLQEMLKGDLGVADGQMKH